MTAKPSLKSLSLKELDELEALVKAERASRQSKPAKAGAKGNEGVITYTDGASRGNPGLAGVGVLIYDASDEKCLLEDFEFLGQCTNNEAEYRALMLALDRAAKITSGPVKCFMDSELLARQMSGRYAIKSEKLIALAQDVRERAARFSSISFNHVPREHPRLRLADALANKAIDTR